MLTNNVRDDNEDIVQPVKIMFTKEPVRLAIAVSEAMRRVLALCA